MPLNFSPYPQLFSFSCSNHLNLFFPGCQMTIHASYKIDSKFSGQFQRLRSIHSTTYSQCLCSLTRSSSHPSYTPSSTIHQLATDATPASAQPTSHTTLKALTVPSISSLLSPLSFKPLRIRNKPSTIASYFSNFSPCSHCWVWSCFIARLVHSVRLQYIRQLIPKDS